MGELYVIHHYDRKVLEKGASGRMKVRHHIVGAPSPQQLDIVAVHSPKEDFHCTVGPHDTSVVVFRAETQVGADVTGRKTNSGCDLGSADPAPLGDVIDR